MAQIGLKTCSVATNDLEVFDPPAKRWDYKYLQPLPWHHDF